MSVRQYGRKLSLIVGTDGNGIELADLRVKFTIRRGDLQTPNAADVRIYNVSAQTAVRLEREFTQVIIQAGYEGNFGLIFTGTIKQSKRGRESATDSYIDIVAADGDQAYNFATMSLSLAAGCTPYDQLSAIQIALRDMARGAIQPGYYPELSRNGRVRGIVHYGMVRDELRDFAEQNDCLWSIQDGKLTLIPRAGYIPGQPVLISPQSGLVGVPEVTQNGIEMRILLNPGVRIGQLVKLDSTINPYRYSLNKDSQADNAALSTSNTKTNADGLYYVMNADHTGDTRANEWYTDLTCLAVDAEIPLDFAPKSAILPEAASIRRD